MDTGTDFRISLKFGDKDIYYMPHMLEEFTIIQDIDSFLPAFRLSIQDTDGIFSHVLPFDESLSKVYVGFNRGSELTNSFDFKVYRRFIKSSAGVANVYDINGLLDIDGLFAPDRSRGFSGTIKSTLEFLATEVGVSSHEISSSLLDVKNIVQPNWSNAQLLKYLAENLSGSNLTAGYYCFFKRKRNMTSMVFRSLTEFNESPVAQRYVISEVQTKSDKYLPVFDHDIIDNYKAFGVFAAKRQPFSYYNYDTSSFVESSYDFSGFVALADHFMIDENDLTEGQSIDSCGRTNAFTSDFLGKVKGSYFKRLSDLTTMWIFSIGNENLVPGDVVLVEFPRPKIGEQVFSRHYAGYWLVKRVVHTLGHDYKNRILLCRSGLDVDLKTSMLKSGAVERLKS